MGGGEEKVRERGKRRVDGRGEREGYIELPERRVEEREKKRERDRERAGNSMKDRGKLAEHNCTLEHGFARMPVPLVHADVSHLPI